MSTPYDISVIVTAHGEGALAHRTWRSLTAAMDYAAASGIRCERVVMLDAPTAATQAYFASAQPEQLLEINCHDPGEARNLGVAAARGRYVAFLDADDLFGRRWLAQAFRQAEESAPAPCVLTPATVLAFEACLLRHDHISSTDAAFCYEEFLESNYWNSVVLAPRTLLREIPFVPTPSDSGFGFEDWHWVSRVLAHDIPVRVVPETCVFIRRKKSASRLLGHSRGDALLPPSPCFAPREFVQRARQTAGPRTVRHRAGLRGWLQQAGMQLTGLGKRLAERFPATQPLLESAYRCLRRSTTPKLEGWLEAEWQAIHQIEPQLYPDLASRAAMDVYRVPCSALGEAYRELCAQVERPVSHVYLLPWLKTGGADLEALYYIRAAVEHSDQAVLVLTTEDADSPWAKRLPQQAQLMDLSCPGQSLTPTERQRLLANFLVQLQPQVIHNLNSRLGYDVFVRFGRALRQNIRLYVSSFCEDFTLEGKMAGYPFEHLPHCWEELNAIFSDNRRFLDRLQELYAIEPERMYAHYQPIELSPIPPQSDEEKPCLDVLWAGRLDRQKRPDLLVAIAERCRHLPIRFHAYGSTVLDRQHKAFAGSSAPNLTFHGSFDRLQSLPLGKFDLFLNTSQWDGLPNILLEAIAAGLPVMTSDAGGIPELIVNDQTGILISPFDDVEQYVRRLEQLCSTRQQLPQLVTQARQLVSQRHSWQRFVQAIAAVPGYLPNTAAWR